MAKTQLDDYEALRTVVAALQDFQPADQERILRWAQEKLGLSAKPPPHQQSPAHTASAQHLPAAPSTHRSANIKSFVDSKNPKSDTQFAATVAYYFRFEAPEAQRKASITKDDLQEATRQAVRGRLKNPAQTLVNAHAQGYLDRGERGAYVVNAVGENLVAMALPESGSSAQSRNRKKPRVMGRTGKRKKKTQ